MMTEDFYEDPEHLMPVGPGRRRQRPILSEMVPVRFPQDMITAVKRFAGQDGMTVSTWIRRLVTKEIERREPPATATDSAEPPSAFEVEGAPSFSTTAPAAHPELVPC